MRKFVMLKSILSLLARNYTTTYCQTLEDVPWLLRLEKPKKRQKFSKNASFIKQMQNFVILKKLKTSMANKNFSETYYQTLKEVF